MAAIGTQKIAIIGAGMAGLACASALKAGGAAPVIFEKSRGIGGRIATRRHPDGYEFDHGAQFFTIRTDAFRDFTRHARDSGLIAAWPLTRKAHMARLPARADTGYAGAPRMNAFLKPIAAALDIRLETEITMLARENDHWVLRDLNNHPHGPFSHIVITAPAPQCARLLRDHEEGQALVGDAGYAPSWTLMLAFDRRLEITEDTIANAGPIGWMARNSAKPARAPAETWVIQMGADWSTEHLEMDKETAEGAILHLFDSFYRDKTGNPLPAPALAMAHRWRYALVTHSAHGLFGVSTDQTVLTAGDWRAGPRVECAFESGRAAALHLLSLE